MKTHQELGKKCRIKEALAFPSAEVTAWYIPVAVVTPALVPADEGIKT